MKLLRLLGEDVMMVLYCTVWCYLMVEEIRHRFLPTLRVLVWDERKRGESARLIPKPQKAKIPNQVIILSKKSNVVQ